VRLLAEKVESRERARLCLAIGIDLFQGYLYGRPAVLAA
jgi:EAL domain-containing protein (putative c-di-GMP-specific phosphodiesterase class I)